MKPQTVVEGPGVEALPAAVDRGMAAVRAIGDGRARCPGPSHLVSRPQSWCGCRVRSPFGSQEAGGFPGPSGVLTDCGLLRFRRRPGDVHGPGHQIACRTFQYRGLVPQHMAAKDRFEARRQYRGRHGLQFSAEVTSLRHVLSGGSLPGHPGRGSRPGRHGRDAASQGEGDAAGERAHRLFSIGGSVAHFSQRQTFRPGDMTEIEADGIGKMTTPVVAGSP